MAAAVNTELWQPFGESALFPSTTCPSRCPAGAARGRRGVAGHPFHLCRLRCARRRDPDLSETERRQRYRRPGAHGSSGPSLFGDARCSSSGSPRTCATPRSWSRCPPSRPWPRARPCCCSMPAGRRARRCWKRAESSAPSRSRAQRSPGPTSVPTSCVRRSAAPAGGSSQRPLRRCSRPWAATCANSRRPARSWSATPAGIIDVDTVRAYHQGRAEVSGFAISDLAVVGNAPAALEALRYALDVGVPYVVIADALADGVRTIARVGVGLAGGSEYQLASKARHAAVEGEAGSRGSAAAGPRRASAVLWAWSPCSTLTSRVRRPTRRGPSSGPSAGWSARRYGG